MNILIIGSGGREHAFAWKIAQSSKLANVFVAPGNAGTSAIATNLLIDVLDFTIVKEAVLEHAINLVLVGPEIPLVAGIHDFFASDDELKHVKVIGPKKYAAQLEGSKEFAKEYMMRHHIPTAAYQSFTVDTLADGCTFLESLKPPYVLKADGLAAGKGVVILDNLQDAKQELKQMLQDQKFGNASAKVVIEEFLSGIEMSCFVLTDGKNYVTLPNAKDYKRIGEGDTGLNTGGMGAVSPVSFADEVFLSKVDERIVKPTIQGLKKDGIDYVGFIFIGLIKVNGDPFVIEYNVRMGDPETEVVIPRIKSDFVDLLTATANQSLDTFTLEIDEQAATTVMLVSGGYPSAYENGKTITGLDSIENSVVFHAGTKQINNQIVTNGGRVLAITSFGVDFKEALKTSYQNAEKIKFDDMYYRKDIGFDL
ncbi:MAG: phosphoribosylamine--glycine ligase [Bacteroidetes bacterium]|jgi:phosphoribosylamine--glycine ligase|nr:phosphoribosylamine--glycine ligase [Bacteroidota bacterium]